jgi:hypothetical protein
MPGKLTACSVGLGIFGAALALPLFSARASAQDLHLKKVVEAGRSVAIYGHALWNNDCSTKEIGEVYLDKAPSYGVICVRIEPVKIRMVFRGTTRCFGRAMRGIRVVYFANDGPATMDAFQYTVRYSERHRKTDAVVEIRQGRRSPARPAVPAEVSPGYTQPLGRVAPCTPLVS